MCNNKIFESDMFCTQCGQTHKLGQKIGKRAVTRKHGVEFSRRPAPKHIINNIHPELDAKYEDWEEAQSLMFDDMWIRTKII